MTAPAVLVPVDETAPAQIAERALCALGTTHQQVAASLAAAGHTGRPDVAADCPIARYLLATDPRLACVTVLDDAARLDTADEYARVSLPDPVLAFVARFDLGRYPHLIATSQLYPLADPGTTGGRETAS
ncbi:hypothetical protein ACQP2X_08765 [Actinoplanes sp. CA-131856]